MKGKYTSIKQTDDLKDEPILIEVVTQIENLDERSMIINQDKPSPNNENDKVDAATIVKNEDVSSNLEWNRVKCAGCVGAVAGCLWCGFCPALVCATGCIYAAKIQDGTVGDIARACDSIALKANIIARDIDKKHHVTENSKKAAVTLWNKVKKLNDNHKIVTKTVDCVKSSVKAGIEYSQKHQLVEWTVQGVGKVISKVAKKITPSKEESNSTGESK